MLQDLECYVDCALRFDGNGNVVGRNGGIRGWLREFLPELSPKYKTLMRYKSLARRLRQAVDVRDPVPVDTLLPPLRAEGPDGSPAPSDPPSGRPCAPVPAVPGGRPRTAGKMRRAGRPGAVRGLVPGRARQRAWKILRGCPNTFAALFRAVDAALE